MTTVDSGAFLKGTGTVGPLTVSGTISPGNSPGQLNVEGNTTWNSGGTYAWEAGDLLNINNGSLNISILPGDPKFNINVSGVTELGRTYDIVTTT